MDRSKALLDLLVQRGVISLEQADEALQLSTQTVAKLEDVLVKLNFATADEVTRALAELHGMLFVDLTALTIPLSVIELIPESVARENIVIPLGQAAGVLFVVMCDPLASYTLQKLQFILNREIQPALAPCEQIIDAINRHYNQTDFESVDSLLREFTDTQIDFTESELLTLEDDASGLDECDYDLALSEEEHGCECEEVSAVVALDEEADEEAATVQEVAPALREGKPRKVQRQATVRHYHRMNPEKTFPLFVVISRRKILEVIQRGVRQKTSERFEVATGSVVEVEPILPGCTCYPPREQVRIGAADAVAKFWVVPQVLGKVMQARVVVRQDGNVLAEVPLEMRVVKQTLTVLMASLTCLLPLLATVLQHFGIDLRSRLEDGLYSRLAGLLLGSVSPDTLALFLCLATLGLYLWLRPRKRDVFWDITAVGPEEPAPAEPQALTQRDDTHELELFKEILVEHAQSQTTWILCAERCSSQKDHEGALRFYRKAFDMGKAPASAYARAALAAGYLGKNALALSLLREAVEKLPRNEITGAMWYNMGCFATRLGALQDAMSYLGQAVDAGYAKLAKFRTDPDLSPLRKRGDFQTLLACIDS